MLLLEMAFMPPVWVEQRGTAVLVTLRHMIIVFKMKLDRKLEELSLSIVLLLM